MMCVKTVLKASPIHGIGLFADEDIKEGQVIWKFNPLVDIILTKEQMDELNPACRQQVLNYAFMSKDGRYVLDQMGLKNGIEIG